VILSVNASRQTNLSVPDSGSRLRKVDTRENQGIRGGAVFDPSGFYRYKLWRRWSDHDPIVTFVMLNPSTADAITDDPTIRRCMGLARRWGFGTLIVVNLFGMRTTDPRELRNAEQPVGPLNDDHVSAAVGDADRVVAAWGNWGSLRGRAAEVMNLVPAGIAVDCLGLTACGAPRHPLYVRNDIDPVPISTQDWNVSGMLSTVAT